ncbi:MAG: hypothetical protein ACFFB5_13060 [Promethearchaeota archaeon]
MVWYGKFKELKDAAWIKWMRKNKKRIEEVLIPGMKFIGVYIIINATADHDFEMWYEIDNWAVLDRERDNKKAEELNLEMFAEIGMPFEWMHTKFLRTLDDVKFMDFEV